MGASVGWLLEECMNNVKHAFQVEMEVRILISRRLQIRLREGGIVNKCLLALEYWWNMAS